MSDAQQAMQRFWLTARKGTMCGREQARAWALREAWLDQHVERKVARAKLTRKDLYGMLEFVRKRVFVAGQGKAHPTGASLAAFFLKVDRDPSWFPGRKDPGAATPGPAPVLTGVKRRAVVEAAMALKRRKVEPTYASIIAQCPNAVTNPKTDAPVHSNRVYKVIREDCYDNDPSSPWRHQGRVAKKALTTEAMRRRLDWGKSMQPLPHTGAWYYHNLVWTDICNSALPRSAKMANEQALARKGGKGWISSDSKCHADNMRGDTNALKLSGAGTERVYWAPILSRGKLHVEMLPRGFPGETEQGAVILMQKVRNALNVRFQGVAKPPNVIFVDRGNGFYVQTTGDVTPAYKAALRDNGLRNYMGDNCGLQPGQLGDVLLHETAVAWVRRREWQTVPTRAWEETREDLGHRLKEIVNEFNIKYDVEALCRAFPHRLQKLVDGKGNKLKT